METLLTGTLNIPPDDTVLTPNLIARIEEVTAHSWAPSTLSTYGSGLLLFHVFCDLHEIPEQKRAPISTDVLKAFIAATAGTYSKSAIDNHVCSVRAWHLINSVPWPVDSDSVKLMVRAAWKLAPAPKPERVPFTVHYIAKLLKGLDPDSTLDVAVAACLTTSFWTAARLGEFTTPTIKTAFNPNVHIALSGVSTVKDRKGNTVTRFKLPRY
jgi:hypothetical protein